MNLATMSLYETSEVATGHIGDVVATEPAPQDITEPEGHYLLVNTGARYLQRVHVESCPDTFIASLSAADAYELGKRYGRDIDKYRTARVAA